MKSYTDLNQSKKLAEILPLESADMEYLLEHWIDEKTGRHKEEYYEIPVVKADDDCPLQPITLPCWSLAALLGALKEGALDFANSRFRVYSNGVTKYMDNPIDACYEMIIKLDEQKLL